MKDLLYDVVNDLADGHIDRAEAKQRIDRIVSACEERSPAPEHVDIMPISPDRKWPRGPARIWCENAGTIGSQERA